MSSIESPTPRKRKATASDTPMYRKKKPKITIVEQLLSPVMHRKKTEIEAMTEEEVVSARIDHLVKQSLVVQEQQANVALTDRIEKDAEKQLAVAKKEQKEAEEQYNYFQCRKETATSGFEKYTHEEKQLAADRARAECEFAKRAAKIVEEKEKLTATVGNLTEKVDIALERKIQAGHKVSAAEKQVEQSKASDHPGLHRHLENYSRYFDGKSASQVFAKLKIPFEFATGQYFTRKTPKLRAFIKALQIYGYDKGKLLRSKHDMRYDVLWRDSCIVLGIPVEESDDQEVAQAKQSLEAFWEQARALQAQQMEDDGGEDSASDDEDSVESDTNGLQYD